MDETSSGRGSSSAGRWLRIAVVGAIVIYGAFLLQRDFTRRATGNFRTFQGQVPPELPTGGKWFNSTGPLSLADLRGKVVFLKFSFLG